jgi:predicted RNase H-like HicB family nuclease
MTMQYHIELEREDDGRWIAEIPAIAGVLLYGRDRRDAIARVQALALRVLSDRLRHPSLHQSSPCKGSE